MTIEMNRDCCWCACEKDLGEHYCTHPDHKNNEDDYPCIGCRDYKTVEDAKAEWKYRDKEELG